MIISLYNPGIIALSGGVSEGDQTLCIMSFWRILYSPKGICPMPEGYCTTGSSWDRGSSRSDRTNCCNRHVITITDVSHLSQIQTGGNVSGW